MRPASSCTAQTNGKAVDGSASRRALIGAAGSVAVVAAVPAVRRLLRLGDALASPSKAQDAAILQLVLRLEYTQVAFYDEALQRAGLKGDLRDFARTVLEHERDHLAAIQKALGAKARARPAFDFGNRTKDPAAFTRAAIALEDTAVAGYNGQAANLTKPTLAAAAEIVSVEARHAAWIRAIADQVAAPDPVDKPLTAKETARQLQAIGLKAER